jgi:hypothetical protein
LEGDRKRLELSKALLSLALRKALARALLRRGLCTGRLAGKFAYTRFEPSGWTNNPDIRRANSIVDYLFRWLGNECSEEFRASQQHGAQRLLNEEE